MIISQTPLRVSLFGGGTDFPHYYQKYGGAVLSMAIDKYIYCIVKERFDSEIWINYSKKEVCKQVNEIQHDIVRESLKLLNIDEGIEVSFLADIPTKGTGLASSSAVTVGLLNALHCYKGETVSSEQLIKEACYIEIEVLKKPIGVQDQTIVALGNLRFIKFPGGKSEVIKLSENEKYELENRFTLLYTEIERSADGILKNIDWTNKQLDAMKALAKKGKSFIESGNFKELGNLLCKAWEIKKKWKGVTNGKIDQLYQSAMDAGAYGGKLIGAGGGGFLLIIGEKKIQLDCRELSFRISKTGSRILLNI